MSKKHHSGPVPPANRPPMGPTGTAGEAVAPPGRIQDGGEVESQQEEPKNRIGDFTGKGEHSIQEPGGKNGANH